MFLKHNPMKLETVYPSNNTRFNNRKSTNIIYFINRLKEKKYFIILINTIRKRLKISTFILDKGLSKLGIR